MSSQKEKRWRRFCGNKSFRHKINRSAAEARMEERRGRAYLVRLGQGLLHLKWDLARFYGGLSLSQPWRLFRESRAVRTASFRAFAFHNLAIFAASDFAGFSEEKFWADIDSLRRDCPDALCPYREVF